MKKQTPHQPRTTGRPVDKRQFMAMILGLGALLLLLVTAFLYGRWYLSVRLAGETTVTTVSTTTGQQESVERLPVVPEQLVGNLEDVPEKAFLRGRSIVSAVSDPFGLINPLYSSGDADHEAATLIFEPLIRLDPEGFPEPVLAESMVKDLASGLVKIRLRADHIWRDGRSVNADDVLFTYRCLLSPSYDGPLKGRFSDIQSVEAGPVEDGLQTVLFTFHADVHAFSDRLFTVGILKHDYYQVPEDKVYEMGLMALPPEGSGPYAWTRTENGRRVLNLREGFAGDIQEITQLVVGSDEKYPMLMAGELDMVRHDWNSRINSRIDRLPGYSLFRTGRIELYLLTPPDRSAKGLPEDAADLLMLLNTATGQSSGRLIGGESLALSYFSGIEETEQRERTAMARLIADRLEAAGQPVTLDPMNLPDLAQRVADGNFQLMLMPAAADNRLPEYAVLEDTRDGQPVNAVVASRRIQVILASARLADLTVNPNGAPFSAYEMTCTDWIANVRILNRDGSRLSEESG